MHRCKLLIVGGTYDCHEFISRFENYNVDISVTVATQSGKEFLTQSDIDIVVGRLDRDGFKQVIVNRDIDLVLDCSHPYACEVTNTVSSLCQKLNLPYIRYLRPSLNVNDAIYVPNSDAAADMLADIDGNIFLTTGSKDLNVYTQKIQDYKQRLFVRIIPALESIKRCEDLNIPISNIVAVSGIFSQNMNVEMMKHFNAKILVTKDSGRVGGFEQKIKAAQSLDMKIIVIQRQIEPVQAVSDYNVAVQIAVDRLKLERII